MALTKYCPDCAFPNQYTLDLPRFCGGCGKSLEAKCQPKDISSADKKSEKQISSSINHHALQEIEKKSLLEDVPDFDASVLSIEPIEADNRKGIKFGVLAEQRRNDENIRPRIKGKKVNSRKIIDEIRKEAGFGVGRKSIEIQDNGAE